MSATSRTVCDSHSERAVSNLFSLLSAPISSSSAKISIIFRSDIGDKLIDKKKAIMCNVSLEPAVNGHFVCNTQIVIEK